jgi:hypothetical protein
MRIRPPYNETDVIPLLFPTTLHTIEIFSGHVCCKRCLILIKIISFDEPQMLFKVMTMDMIYSDAFHV